jgi:hypothetical protein
MHYAFVVLVYLPEGIERTSCSQASRRLIVLDGLH